MDKGHSSSDDSISSTDDSDDDAYETPSQAENEKEDWKNFLGSDDSPKVEIVIRYPNGDRENVIFPSSSKMKVKCNWLTKTTFTFTLCFYQSGFIALCGRKGLQHGRVRFNY